jgi:hypothetical protein
VYLVFNKCILMRDRLKNLDRLRTFGGFESKILHIAVPPRHARKSRRGLFATEEARHSRLSAQAAGRLDSPGAMFASVVRSMMGVSAEPRKFRCARYMRL